MSSNFEKCRDTLKERTTVLFTSGELSDCTFIVGENKVEIKAHKIFLAIASPAFHAMFYGDIAEKDESILIKDLEPAAFKGMLEYIYTDKVSFESTVHACDVFIAAKKYILPFLVTYCEQFISDNAEATEACELYEFAKFHDVESIQKACVELFREETNDVLLSQAFVEADLETVKVIVEQDVLSIASELQLFQAIELWAYKEAERLDATIEEVATKMDCVVSHLRLLSLTADEFATAPALSSLLSTQERLAVAMNITRSGTMPYPERLSKIAKPRKPLPQPVPYEAVWSLRRYCQDNQATFEITKWSNPFPRIGIRVSRPIRIRGVKISSQKKTLLDGGPRTYEEKVTLVLKKDWAIKFHGALYHGDAHYNTELFIKFPKAVMVEPEKLYWLIVQYDRPGNYLFTKDVSVNYSSHNMDITLTSDFSTITELMFADIPPKPPVTAMVTATTFIRPSPPPSND
ncbi:BTB/POZ domain-containing protein 6 [Nilaparvata lugens]|uniref:BTB/POZ domain-containing protein 6 n=1 Tax=Nilaparvata lugens TaxID=108931 RepID=UPI00193DF392|nr:BTB/POZ domain-containing protein 6 [Nilaparvata lugens]